MLTSLLDDILGPSAKLSVLRILFRQDDLTGREVARRADLSPRAASQALTRLVEAGVVRRKPAGQAHLFSVNRRRRGAFSALGELFAAEQGLSGSIGRYVAKTAGGSCVAVAVFGSYARGTAVSQSDLDVMVLLDDARVAPKVSELFAERAGAFHDEFGLRLSPYVISTAEFAARFKRNDALIKAVVREGRVVAGKPLAEVLADESQEKRR
ncbi:MAG: MarR family transcriptional regulator [Elusimicrobia bacterium]|nr:MarR family transcriptional regulator [Elusimicrobiota bacterium]